MAAIKSSIDEYWKNDFSPLEAAGKVILTELREDEAVGDLHRRILSPGSHLYFNSSNDFSHQRSIPLPPHLEKEVKSVKVSLLMGLLPEINLAWMSVDHKLFLWSIDDENENFMDLEIKSGQCIVSVGLAPPKKGTYLVGSLISYEIIIVASVKSFLLLVTDLSPRFSRRVHRNCGVVFGGIHTR